MTVNENYLRAVYITRWINVHLAIQIVLIGFFISIVPGIMNYKNEFFPFTRLGNSHKVVYLKEGATHTYEIYNTEEPVTHTITVCCNGNYGITSVKWEDKSRDQHLYLSLKRFKGKIGWNQHFNAD